MKKCKISGSTITALKNNDYVTLAVIEKLCHLLNCSPEDIIEQVTDESLIKGGFNDKL